MREIEGASPPARQARSLLFVRWPTLPVPMEVTLLGETPLGLTLHVMADEKDGRTFSRACALPDLCANHGHALRDGWAGFLAAYSHTPMTTVILPFTADAWADLSDGLQDGEPARLTRWELKRGGGKANGPWVIRRLAQRMGAGQFADAVDIRPALAALYGDVPQLRIRAAPVLSDEMGGAE